MKRVYLREMDWTSAQSWYDSGLNVRQLATRMGVGQISVTRAVKAGLLKTRSLSEAAALAQQLNPRDYSVQRGRRTPLTNYRADCKFKFNLKDYPDEFDFDLIKQFGW